MKIKEIKLNALINIGPYSHVTMDFTAELSEGEHPIEILNDFKQQATNILNDNFSLESIPRLDEGTQIPVSELPPVEPEGFISEETPVEETKKTRKSKKSTTAKTEEVKTPKNVELYDRTIKEHTSTLSAYLTKHYGDAWKKVEGVKAFSESLNGSEFRNTDTGNLVDSFVEKLTAFFGGIELAS